MEVECLIESTKAFDIPVTPLEIVKCSRGSASILDNGIGPTTNEYYFTI